MLFIIIVVQLWIYLFLPCEFTCVVCSHLTVSFKLPESNSFKFTWFFHLLIGILIFLYQSKQIQCQRPICLWRWFIFGHLHEHVCVFRSLAPRTTPNRHYYVCIGRHSRGLIGRLSTWHVAAAHRNHQHLTHQRTRGYCYNRCASYPQLHFTVHVHRLGYDLFAAGLINERRNSRGQTQLNTVTNKLNKKTVPTYHRVHAWHPPHTYFDVCRWGRGRFYRHKYRIIMKTHACLSRSAERASIPGVSGTTARRHRHRMCNVFRVCNACVRCFN